MDDGSLPMRLPCAEPRLLPPRLRRFRIFEEDHAAKTKWPLSQGHCYAAQCVPPPGPVRCRRHRGTASTEKRNLMGICGPPRARCRRGTCEPERKWLLDEISCRIVLPGVHRPAYSWARTCSTYIPCGALHIKSPSIDVLVDVLRKMARPCAAAARRQAFGVTTMLFSSSPHHRS